MVASDARAVGGDAWTLGVSRLAQWTAKDPAIDAHLRTLLVQGEDASMAGCITQALGAHNPRALVDALDARLRADPDAGSALPTHLLQSIPVERFCEDEPTRRVLVDWLIGLAARGNSRAWDWALATTLSRAMSLTFDGPEVAAVEAAVARLAESDEPIEDHARRVLPADGGDATYTTTCGVDPTEVPIEKRVIDLLAGRIAQAGRSDPSVVDRWAGLMDRLLRRDGIPPQTRAAAVGAMEIARPPMTKGVEQLVANLKRGSAEDPGITERLDKLLDAVTSAREAFVRLASDLAGRDSSKWRPCIADGVLDEAAARLGVSDEEVLLALRDSLVGATVVSVCTEGTASATVSLKDRREHLREIAIERTNGVWKLSDSHARIVDWRSLEKKNAGGPVEWSLARRTADSPCEAAAAWFGGVPARDDKSTPTPDVTLEACGWLHLWEGVNARPLGHGRMERHDGVPPGREGWTGGPICVERGEVWVLRIRRPRMQEYFVLCGIEDAGSQGVALKWRLLRDSEGAPAVREVSRKLPAASAFARQTPCTASHSDSAAGHPK